jgi:hypothetical protein
MCKSLKIARNRSRWGSKAFRNCSETQWHCQRKESTALPLCIQRHVNATQWREIERISIYGAQCLLPTWQSDIMPCCRIGMHSIRQAVYCNFLIPGSIRVFTVPRGVWMNAEISRCGRSWSLIRDLVTMVRDMAQIHALRISHIFATWVSTT